MTPVKSVPSNSFVAFETKGYLAYMRSGMLASEF